MILPGATAASGKDRPLHPDVVVSGAGSPEVEGRYTYRGEAEGHHYYNLLGQPDEPQRTAVSWLPKHATWGIYDGDKSIVYRAPDETSAESPYDTAGWVTDNGATPVPMVTEG